MIIYLYHKKHKITGLNYFGKTKQDPLSYDGSGVYWSDHLRKHGRLIETVKVWKFNDLSECSKFAIDFSLKNNIVESNDWANLCIENGLDGGDKFSDMNEDKLKDINLRKSKNIKKSWQNKNRIDANVQSARSQWANRTEAEKQNIFNQISQTLLNKTPEQRAEIRRKRHETESKRPPTICPHCGKVGKGISNMKRYHLDNCKFKFAQ